MVLFTHHVEKVKGAAHKKTVILTVCVNEPLRCVHTDRSNSYSTSDFDVDVHRNVPKYYQNRTLYLNRAVWTHRIKYTVWFIISDITRSVLQVCKCSQLIYQTRWDVCAGKIYETKYKTSFFFLSKSFYKQESPTWPYSSRRVLAGGGRPGEPGTRGQGQPPPPLRRDMEP